MMKRLSALLLMSVIALSPAGAKKNNSYVCTLTNQKVSSCCCTKKDGKLYCNLAKRTVDNCCCKSSSAMQTITRAVVVHR